MPSGRFHAHIAKTLLGDSFEKVNATMDFTTRLHPGYKHRKDLVHSEKFVAGFATSDRELAAARLHLNWDRSGLTVRQSQKIEKLLGIDNKAYRYRVGKYRTVNRRRNLKR